MIGIFDSGSGGLTVLKAIREQMPSADIMYFGDIKNAPYGSRSNVELAALTVGAIELLQERGATSIVSACNSVSASLAVSLFDTLALAPDRLIEMVGPTVSALRDVSNRLVLVATPATIQSEVYQNAFRMVGKEIMAIAIPDLAGAIEFGSSEDEIERIIKEANIEAVLTEGDSIILACTHYPLVRHIFERAYLGVQLFDPAQAVGERVKRRFWPREVGDGSAHFILSKDSEPFRDRVAALGLKGEMSIEVLA